MAQPPSTEAGSETFEMKYIKQAGLKYGCNPLQQPSYISTREGLEMPFKVLNGRPGYINLCDALNAWQLVKELRQALDLPAAASFKHVSPAGAAVGVPLSPTLAQAYEAPEDLSPLALAYLRARNADPKSSFGDFIALSDPVDVSTAKVIKSRISDGIIAPGYDEEALRILSAKKGGKYCVLLASKDYSAPEMEHREIYGLLMSQKRNDFIVTAENSLKPEQIVTANKKMPDEAKRDLVIAAIACKYTQSNSVCFAKDGQVIGVGAGQQSRVDCVKLAKRKAEIWWLRQHPKVLGMKFVPKTKRVDRTNCRIGYIEGDMTKPEREFFNKKFEELPGEFSQGEQSEFVGQLTDVSIVSDAFFPFRDNIDQASKIGVKYILQPGGSARDQDVISACDEYNMVMACNNARLFHH